MNTTQPPQTTLTPGATAVWPLVCHGCGNQHGAPLTNRPAPSIVAVVATTTIA